MYYVYVTSSAHAFSPSICRTVRLNVYAATCQPLCQMSSLYINHKTISVYQSMPLYQEQASRTDRETEKTENNI